MAKHTYEVETVEHITATTLLLTLKHKNVERLFSFQPGQYAAISFYRHRRPTAARCFSIVSSPTEQGKLQFSMRTKGHYTKAIGGLKRGDIVKVLGPFGGFVFDSSLQPEIVLLAGGIGITPFMSMVRYAAAANLSNKVTLIYSCQNQDDIPFRDELVELERRNPNFKTVFVISDGPTDKLTGHKISMGRISPENIHAAVPSFANKTFFVCGPPPFMKAVNQQLQGMNVPKSLIMTEAFSQGPNRQTGKIKSWPFNIYVLGALGVAFASFLVMVSDLLKTLPPSTLLSDSSTVTKEKLTSNRQQDLDALVNELPGITNTGPATNAVTEALLAAKKASSSSSAAASSTTTKSTSTTPTSTKSTAPSTTTTTTKSPVCTTSQSGVTTCI